MTVAVELLPDDDPMMIGWAVTSAVKEAMGDRQGVASMRAITREPIEDVLDQWAPGTRTFDLGDRLAP